MLLQDNLDLMFNGVDGVVSETLFGTGSPGQQKGL